MEFLRIMIWIERISILLAGMLSVFCLYNGIISKKKIPIAMYCVISSFVSTTQILLSQNLKNYENLSVRGYLANGSLVLHLIILSIFIINHITVLRYRKIITITTIISLFLLLPIFYFWGFSTRNQLAYYFVNLNLFLFCIFYFYNILKSDDHIFTFNLPEFWIISGILLGMTLAIPTFSFVFISDSLHIVDQTLQNKIYSIAPIGYLIMYLFFSKGFLCIYRNPKTY